MPGRGQCKCKDPFTCCTLFVTAPIIACGVSTIWCAACLWDSAHLTGLCIARPSEKSNGVDEPVRKISRKALWRECCCGYHLRRRADQARGASAVRFEKLESQSDSNDGGCSESGTSTHTASNLGWHQSCDDEIVLTHGDEGEAE